MSDQGSSKRESVIARSLTLTPHKSNPLQDKTNKKKELDEGRYAPRDFYIPTTGALGWSLFKFLPHASFSVYIRMPDLP